MKMTFTTTKKSIHNCRKYCDENFGDSREVDEHIKLIHSISMKQNQKSSVKILDKALDFEEFVDLDLTKLC